MTRPAATALVALLVAVAGCSALPGDGGGPPGTTLAPAEGPDPTVEWPGSSTPALPAGATAVAAPDGEGTAVPARVAATYPPGVAPGGVYDRSALVGAHGDRLRRTSYTLTWTARDRAPDGTLRSSVTHRLRADGPAGRRLARVTVTDPNGTAEWAAFRANGTTSVRDGARPDPPATTVPRVRGGFREDPTGAAEVAALVGAFAVDRVERRRQVDGPHFLIVADRVTAPAALVDDPGARVTDASLVALVDASGVVRWLRAEYDVARDGTRTHRRLELRVSLVGSTTVDRPGWAAPAEASGDGPGTTTGG